MKNTRQKGNVGENFAENKLSLDGYRILCRNYKGKHGEIDIICEKNTYIFFVEVKTREILTERPVFSVNEKKKKHIIDAANEFLWEYKDNNYISSLVPRFCIFEVITKNGEIADFSYIEDAFRQ